MRFEFEEVDIKLKEVAVQFNPRENLGLLLLFFLLAFSAYFNSEGRGMYHYLTGSASWVVLTLLTQVFGIKGVYGDLLLSPKITKNEFHPSNEVYAETHFAGKKFRIVYKNPKKIPYEHYYVSKVTLNGKALEGVELHRKEVLIKKELLLKYSRKSLNILAVTLE